MKLQKLYSYTRQAINDFQLIQDGDKIAIGVSGGKDSLALLYALSGLKKFIPEKIELIAITIDLGYENKTHQEEVNLNVCKRALRDLLFAPYDEIEVKKENHHESM